VYRWRESDSGLGIELGNSSHDAKENSIRGSTSKGNSTDACEEDGSSRRSVEASVMGCGAKGMTQLKGRPGQLGDQEEPLLPEKAWTRRRLVHGCDEPYESRGSCERLEVSVPRSFI
jgi:hypothetical protein